MKRAPRDHYGVVRVARFLGGVWAQLFLPAQPRCCLVPTACTNHRGGHADAADAKELNPAGISIPASTLRHQLDQTTSFVVIRVLWPRLPNCGLPIVARWSATLATLFEGPACAPAAPVLECAGVPQ